MKWIKTSDKLPTSGSAVLFVDYNNKVKAGYYYSDAGCGRFLWADPDYNDFKRTYHLIDIKYWMPFPKPPRTTKRTSKKAMATNERKAN